MGNYFINCKFKTLMMASFGLFWGISHYRSNATVERRQLGVGIGRGVQFVGSPMVHGGNFNVTRCTCDRVGAERVAIALWDFSNFISDLGLIDLPLEGGPFKCSNNHEHISMSRLDKFLIA